MRLKVQAIVILKSQHRLEYLSVENDPEQQVK
ncbi:hypothetical protein CAQUA_05075 [Corynebacterium aquatimens]|uniref:Uncharacterized protein n=1 Tax=Corynebacterium aquatimens TaxID=1190508 RepID=A0A931GRA4_9CORY|nr:hypothetical protein [Corynebacterium aquatimens]WJY65723.1 hypothetical protein CAQUA_05075 [Corynebacterium aquatimens]